MNRTYGLTPPFGPFGLVKADWVRDLTTINHTSKQVFTTTNAVVHCSDAFRSRCGARTAHSQPDEKRCQEEAAAKLEEQVRLLNMATEREN